MARDRIVTMARILGAAEGLIVREGVPAAGINAIAAAAGVDKVLLYRYFGGRAQLLRALARERAVWPTLAVPAAAEGGASLADDVAGLLLALARARRENPVARRAAAWQRAERDEFAREIAAARAAQLRAIAAALRARHRIPPFLDLDAILAVLAGAAVHAALQGAAPPAGGELDLRRSDDWLRAERALRRTVEALLGAPEP